MKNDAGNNRIGFPGDISKEDTKKINLYHPVRIKMNCRKEET